MSLVHHDGLRAFGVEEELLIVDPADGWPLPLASELLASIRTEAGTWPAVGGPVPAVEFKHLMAFEGNESAAATTANCPSSHQLEVCLVVVV